MNTTKTNKNRATHTGECQICGSHQMLPNGQLSKHGYTVQCGFFNGVCAGAHRLPFEQSTDAIAPVVAAVKVDVKNTEAEIAAYRDIGNELNSGNQAWFSVYVGWGYSWAKCDVEITEHTCDDGYKYNTVTRSPVTNESKTNQRQRVELYDFKYSTVREVVHHCNERFAKHLESMNSQRRAWLKWQAERLKNWSVKPLTPRKP